MKTPKSTDTENFLSRRDFARQSACATLGVTGLVNALTHLRLINGAMAASGGADDYKALVCLFLQGGNDANSLLIPISEPHYGDYVDTRGALAIQPKETILPLKPTTYSDGADYGLHPNLGPIKELFDAKQLGILANVGTLVAPTTREDYLAGTAAVPPQLFSHSDQSVQWQSSVPDQPFTTGWGGRVADLLIDLNSESDVSMSISLGGANSFQVGTTTAQYHVSTNGSISFTGYGDDYQNALNADGTYKTTNAGKRLKAFHEIMDLEPGHVFQKAYAETVDRAYVNDLLLTAALEDVNITTEFPDTPLGDQLAMIARLVAAHSGLSQTRQIFFCEIKGFDTHQLQLPSHANLMTELGEAMKAFYDATVEIGLNEKVTTFTASDFGRTFTPNGGSLEAGADHGWGSHALVMGGCVKGGDIYGQMPELEVNGPNDVNGGRGRWIPTTSVDEYSSTLAKWFGVGDSELAAVFPNLDRFASKDLGFMA